MIYCSRNHSWFIAVNALGVLDVDMSFVFEDDRVASHCSLFHDFLLMDELSLQMKVRFAEEDEKYDAQYDPAEEEAL